jgi:PIN domain nuclease of toxin-antitoxin system
MIVIDTHIWVWWVQKDARLTQKHQQWLQNNEADGIGVSIISAWEVAKLFEKNRLVLPLAIDKWIESALAYPGVRLLDLTLVYFFNLNTLTLPFNVRYISLLSRQSHK